MAERVNDNQMVQGLRAGDANAFAELLNRYTQKVYSLAMRITRNAEDAEEVLQDVFVTVHNKIDKFEGKSAFSSWLYRITANTAFMKLRKRRQHQTTSIDEVPANLRESWTTERSDTSDVNYICSKHELREELEAAISKLPDEYRIIFILRDIDGLSNEDVCEMLDLSIPAVKSRLHRSRLMLRKRLQKFYDDYRSAEVIYVGGKYPSAEREYQMAA